MKRSIFLLTLINLLIVVSSSCQDQSAVDRFDDFKKFDQLVENGIVIVDVRTPAEFNDGHIKDAINYNIASSDFKSKISTLDPNQPVLLYCAVGGRSAKAGKILDDMGFNEVYDFSPGFNGWKGKGRPIEK